jgi:hypothetical protein
LQTSQRLAGRWPTCVDAGRAAADAIADKPVDLSTELLRPLGASRAAAYRGITGCADLLTDDRAGTWVEVALAEIDGLTPEPRRAPLDPAVEAFGTLAALADTLACSQAVQLITFTESLLDRPANRHLETDDASVQALTELARQHACVGDRSVRGLLHALLLNDRLADKVLDARDVLQANRQIVGDMLAEPAAQDHHQACLALVVADADGTPALHHARQRVDQLLAPGRTQPYIVTMSAEPRDAAILVRLLSPERRTEFARTMIERAAGNTDDRLDHQRGSGRCAPAAGPLLLAGARLGRGGGPLHRGRFTNSRSDDPDLAMEAAPRCAQ